METVATVPIVDYVTADKRGAVAEVDTAPSKRWNESSPRSRLRSPTSPDLDDGVVYQDEFVNLLVGKLGKATERRDPVLLAGQRAGALAVHAPARPPGEDDLRRDGDAHRGDRHARSSRSTRSAIVSGRASRSAGREFMSLLGCAGRQGEQREVRHLPRLLPGGDEGSWRQSTISGWSTCWTFTGTPRRAAPSAITEKDVSPKTVAARLQAPRSLWDPTYTEKSWIAAKCGQADPSHPLAAGEDRRALPRARSWP